MEGKYHERAWRSFGNGQPIGPLRGLFVKAGEIHCLSQYPTEEVWLFLKQGFIEVGSRMLTGVCGQLKGDERFGTIPFRAQASVSNKWTKGAVYVQPFQQGGRLV